MKAGKATREKINVLSHRLASATRARKAVEKLEKDLRAEIADLVVRYELPISEGASEFMNTTTGYVRVTRPSAPVQHPRTQVLLDILLDHFEEAEAHRVFHSVVLLPATCDIDVAAWNEQKRLELVKDQWLLDALEPQRDPPKPTVHVELGKTKSVS